MAKNESFSESDLYSFDDPGCPLLAAQQFSSRSVDHRYRTDHRWCQRPTYPNKQELFENSALPNWKPTPSGDMEWTDETEIYPPSLCHPADGLKTAEDRRVAYRTSRSKGCCCESPAATKKRRLPDLPKNNGRLHPSFTKDERQRRLLPKPPLCEGGSFLSQMTKRTHAPSVPRRAKLPLQTSRSAPSSEDEDATLNVTHRYSQSLLLSSIGEFC